MCHFLRKIFNLRSFIFKVGTEQLHSVGPSKVLVMDKAEILSVSAPRSRRDPAMAARSLLELCPEITGWGWGFCRGLFNSSCFKLVLHVPVSC